MSRLGFNLRSRDSDTARERFLTREWWWRLTVPAFWARRCSMDCRYDRDRPTVYAHLEPGMGTKDNPGCPRRPRYLGTLAKGWWDLWTWRKDYKRWSTEVAFALGGEDNMAQASLCLPLLGSFAVGFRVPRSWTRSWVYQRREWSVELRGLWPAVKFAYDDSMGDMHDYYRRSYGGPGQEPMPDYLTRASLWTGWRWQPNPYRARTRIADRLFGKMEHTSEAVKVYEDCGVPLPEGVYQGTVTFARDMMKRPRWRARRDDMVGTFRTADGMWMPWPGKGENSYDCGDDGTQEHSKVIGPGSMVVHGIDGTHVAQVLSSTVAMVLRYRARYGRFDWQPDEMGAMR